MLNLFFQKFNPLIFSNNNIYQICNNSQKNNIFYFQTKQTKNKSGKGCLGSAWYCEKCGRSGWDYFYDVPVNYGGARKGIDVIKTIECDLEEG